MTPSPDHILQDDGERRWSRGRLPHMQRDGECYFLTFRLFDSLPRAVLDEIRADLSVLAREKERLSAADRQELKALKEERIQAYLDRGVGACYLRDWQVATVVKEAILFHDTSRYALHAWCVMPNHVHMLFEPFKGHGLEAIAHSIKSFTANEANRLLSRTGSFWQREYHDREVRNERDYESKFQYTLSNPASAGIPDWPFVGYGSAIKSD